MLPDAARLLGPGSPFELIHAEVGAPLVFRHAPSSLSLFCERSGMYGSRAFVHFDGVGVSFAKIAIEAARLATALVDIRGIRRGDRVAILMPDSPAWIAAICGVWRAGAVAVPIDVCTPAGDVRQRLAITECCDLVTTRELAATQAPLGEHRIPVVVSESSDWVDPYYRIGNSICDVSSSYSLPASIAPDADALVLFTSGSSGSPKGVISTHRAVVSGVLNTLVSASLSRMRETRAVRTASVGEGRREPISLLLTPLSHVGGLSHLLLMLHIGGTVIPCRWESSRAATAIRQAPVTVISGADPSVLEDMGKLAQSGHDLSSIQSVSIYGASFPVGALQDFYKHFPGARIGSGYGLTETNGTVASASGYEMIERSGTAGIISPAMEVCIRDDEGFEISDGQPGNIWVRGPSLMRRYISETKDPSQNDFRDGWFRTGDIGRVDSDRFLFIHGRVRDTMTGSHGLLSCSELERAIHADWPVADVAACMTGDADSPSLVVAVTTLTPPEAAEVIAFLHRVAGLPPHRIVLLTPDRIPRLHMGKLDRAALTRMIETQLMFTSGVGK